MDQVERWRLKVERSDNKRREVKVAGLGLSTFTLPLSTASRRRDDAQNGTSSSRFSWDAGLAPPVRGGGA
jgi:hypothetical protein